MTNPIPAPPQTIDVSFELSGGSPQTATFGFTPSTLTLPNTGGTNPTSYQVTFNLTSNVPGATLTSENTVHGKRNLQSSGSGTSQLTIRFDNSGLTQSDTLDYTVTVRANGEPYTSNDPEIVIPPPG